MRASGIIWKRAGNAWHDSFSPAMDQEWYTVVVGRGIQTASPPYFLAGGNRAYHVITRRIRQKRPGLPGAFPLSLAGTNRTKPRVPAIVQGASSFLQQLLLRAGTCLIPVTIMGSNSYIRPFEVSSSPSSSSQQTSSICYFHNNNNHSIKRNQRILHLLLLLSS